VGDAASAGAGMRPIEVKTAAQRKKEKEMARLNLPTTSMILRDPVMTYEDVTVAVQVIRGKNLAKKDFLYSDAYCKVGLVDQSTGAFMDFLSEEQVRGQTQVVWNNLNPKWPPIKFVFNPIVKGKLCSLCFEVWDKDQLKHDDFMGRVIVDLERRDQLRDIDPDNEAMGVQMLNWFVLDNHKLPPDSRTNVSGAIYVAICWERLAEVQKERRRKSAMLGAQLRSHTPSPNNVESDGELEEDKGHVKELFEDDAKGPPAASPTLSASTSDTTPSASSSSSSSSRGSAIHFPQVRLRGAAAVGKKKSAPATVLARPTALYRVKTTDDDL